MKIEERILTRFKELQEARKQVTGYHVDGFGDFVDSEPWAKWSASALNLINLAFGGDSVHAEHFSKICADWHGHASEAEAAYGVFAAACEDYIGGFFVSLEKTVSGELFGDFVQLSKKCLTEGNKDVAAVIACAALEDTLKRFAAIHQIEVHEKTMQDVVGALKSKGLVGGAQKSLLDTMPKIRDYAMHANWEKIRAEDVSSVIGFVEQFLITHF